MSMELAKKLSAEQRALVAVAVLLDGHEASIYLGQDVDHGATLSAAASELATQPPELRMPYVGSLLREALGEIKSKGI